MAVTITGNTQLGATKQDLIAAIVQKEMKFAAKLLQLVTDYSFLAVKGAKSVSIPKLGSFTVQNRASAVEGDVSTVTSSVDTLLLDQKAYVSWIIDSNDEVQTTIDAQLQFASRAAAAHGRYVDDQILTKVFAEGVDLGNAPITNDLVLDMRAQLLASHSNIEDLVFVAGYDQEKELLKLEQFSKADVFGGPMAPIYSGMIGRLYGVPLVLSSNPTLTGKFAIWDKQAVAIAFQKAPAIGSQPEIGYGVGAERVAMDQLFGVKALQVGELGQVAKTPLIAYINTP